MKLRSYAINAGLAALYSLVYVRCYVYFLNYYFDYAGFTLVQRDGTFILVSVCIAVLPVLVYRGIRAISSYVSVFVYVILYIPIILTFALASEKSLAEITAVQLAFMIGMCALFLADSIIIRNPVLLRSGINLMPPVLFLTVASTLYMLVVYRGNLRLVSFGAEVYVQRAANAELGVDLVTRYLSSWLGTVLVPLSLAYGLVAKNYKYFVAGAAACLTIYMATAGKSMILLPFVYWGFYVLFGRGRLEALYPVFAGGLVASLALLLVITRPDGIAFLVSSILMYRTIGNGGQLAVAYYDFFSFHQQTDYSHVNLIREFTHPYPYGSNEIGQVIGKFYWNDEVNANASFWATDGIAAMGLPGLAISTVACVTLFVVMNSVTRGYNKLFACLCFIQFVVTMLNASLFSSVWSGGGFFLLLFFLFNKEDPRLLQASGGSSPQTVR